MKLALVHDFLNQYGGGERVLEALAEIWPEAKIYTSLYDRKLMEPWLKIAPERIHTNFVDKLPFSAYLNKHYFFLYPLAFRWQRIDADVVVSISSFAAKFATPKKGGLHFAYINTPPRFLYGYDQELTGYKHRSFDRYLEPAYKLVVPVLKNFLKEADQAAIKKVDYVIANSNEVKQRIKDKYQRESVVIYPPVETQKFAYPLEKTTEEFFLVVSRLGGYKRVDIVVKAFNQLGKKLKVIGVGPELDYLKSIAKENIEFLGRAPDSQVIKEMEACTALIFPTEEDFGIVPVEANAAGKPVIAFRAGGALETIVEDKTGLFFDEQSSEAIIEVMKKFHAENFQAENCRQQAEKFSKEIFKEKFKLLVEEAFLAKSNGKN